MITQFSYSYRAHSQFLIDLYDDYLNRVIEPIPFRTEEDRHRGHSHPLFLDDNPPYA